MTKETLEQLNVIKIDIITKKIVQEQEKEKLGKYKHIPKGVDENNIEYSVTEYVCPDGSVGFDIFFFNTIDNVLYAKRVCFGSESLQRQCDWYEYKKT